MWYVWHVWHVWHVCAMSGNHEYTSWDPFLFFETHNFVVYNHRFMMPGSTSGAQKSMYYSFDYSNVHFISLSTETSYPDAPFGSTLALLALSLARVVCRVSCVSCGVCRACLTACGGPRRR